MFAGLCRLVTGLYLLVVEGLVVIDPLSLAGLRNNGLRLEDCVVVGFGVVLVVCGVLSVGGRLKRNRGLLLRREDSVVVGMG